MPATSVVGLDTAKSVFQVHGVDSSWKVTLRKRLRRGQLTYFFTNLPVCIMLTPDQFRCNRPDKAQGSTPYYCREAASSKSGCLLERATDHSRSFPGRPADLVLRKS
jgi:hypothetical protein